METKHTPGPWTIVGDETEIKVCHSSPNPAKGKGIEFPAPIVSHVARLHTQWLCEEHGDSIIANARLIAAAPRMYQWLTAHYAIEEGPGRTDRPRYAELKEILEAINGNS